MSQVRVKTVGAILVLVALAITGCQDRASVVAVDRLDLPEGLERRQAGAPRLDVVAPADGAIVMSPVVVEVELENYQLAPKGVSRDGEGHIHVIVGDCLSPGQVIGSEHVHVGDGAATAQIQLEPGRHSLCVQLADGFHTAVAISHELDVVVEN